MCTGGCISVFCFHHYIYLMNASLKRNLTMISLDLFLSKCFYPKQFKMESAKKLFRQKGMVFKVHKFHNCDAKARNWDFFSQLWFASHNVTLFFPIVALYLTNVALFLTNLATISQCDFISFLFFYFYTTCRSVTLYLSIISLFLTLMPTLYFTMWLCISQFWLYHYNVTLFYTLSHNYFYFFSEVENGLLEEVS